MTSFARRKEPALNEKLIEGLREQHRRDSAELRRLCAERDSFQRVGIAAQARADRLAEALRRQRDWWLASKGEAVSNAPGGLTRIDPGFIALCDAHVQQIDLTLRDHDQEVGNG